MSWSSLCTNVVVILLAGTVAAMPLSTVQTTSQDLIVPDSANW